MENKEAHIPTPNKSIEYRADNTSGSCDIERIRSTRLVIDLDCLAWNISQIKSIANSKAIICASMKANAYGHGAVAAAITMLANGADMLSTAFLDEAIELRKARIDAPILVLGALEPRGANEVISKGIIQSISTYGEAKDLSDAAQRLGLNAKVHIKVDTGMGRLGFICSGDISYETIHAAVSLPGICAEGIYTHFATADEADAGYTECQLRKFNAVCGDLEKRGIKIPLKHCSNSAAIKGFPYAHMDMVRPGIDLYGGVGALPGKHHRDMSLKRAMSLRTRVALVKDVPAGTCIGYGRRFVARRTSRIATLPVGYGDGYNRCLSCGVGEILIKGKRAPVAGLICMDQCMVDVTDIGDVVIGDEAVLFGKQGDAEITLEELSVAQKTIPYEIMCAISRRVPRVYTRSGKTIGYVNYLQH